MSGTIKIEGSHGELKVDIATGIIVEAHHQASGGYRDIGRFEPRSLAREAEFGATDILYTGYWTKEGVFEPALTSRLVLDGDVMEFDDMVEMAYLPAPAIAA